MKLLYDFKKKGTKTDKNISHIGGFLMLSERQSLESFFQWQKNNLVYSSFLRHIPIIFTKSSEHTSKYIKKYNTINEKIKLISKNIGIKLPYISKPIIIKCKIKDDEIKQVIFDKTQKQIFDHNSIYTNQISPIAEIIFDKIVSKYKKTIIDQNKYKQASRLAIKFNNKANYVKLVTSNQNKIDLPYHVPTIIIPFDKLKKLTWESLLKDFTNQTNEQNTKEFYIKLAINSGGEINVMINEENFEQKKQLLITETTKANISDANFLAQKKVNFKKGEELTHLGFIYYIKSPKNIKRIDIHAQIYSNETQTTFLGSFISNKLEKRVLSIFDEQKMLNLCKLFAKEGYIGPINFDAIINDNNKLEFIYDCNPRMTGTLPSIAIYNYFKKKHNINIDIIVPLGYRGNLYFSNISKKLNELKSKNLLFTKDNNSGAMLIPNFARDNSYDMWLINMSIKEIKQFELDGYVESLSNKKKNSYKGLYF